MTRSMSNQIKEAQRYLDFLNHRNGPFTKKETEKFRKQLNESTTLRLNHVSI